MGSNGNAGCERDRVYFRPNDLLNPTPPDSCVGLAYIPTSRDADGNNQCLASRTNLQFGRSQYAGRTGSYLGTFIRWFGSGSSNRDWTSTLGSVGNNNFYDLECQADAGGHGNGGSDRYPRSGPAGGNGRWGTDGSGQRSWWRTNTGTQVVLWTSNLIRYTRNPQTTVTTNQSRMTVVKQAAKNLLDSPMLSGMNVGLMRYDTSETGFSGQADDDAAEGGMVLWPALPIDAGTNRQQMKDLIDGIVEAGNTPLSETLYEAYKYFSGGTVEYGADSKVCINNGNAAGSSGNGSADCDSGPNIANYPSVASSRVTGDPTRYQSPIDSACQRNYIVYLTDGLPTSDGVTGGGIRSKVEALPQWGTPLDMENTCDDSRDDHEGECLVGLSEYMSKVDLRPSDEPVQSVKTYFIGFGDDFAGGESDAFAFLQTASAAAGAEAYQANDLPQLEGAFNSVLGGVVDTNTTFTAPTVAVNAFNRTQTLSDLYVAVFQPDTKVHWPGNLKKYTIDEGVILDRNEQEAVDADTGFFKSGAHDLWATSSTGDAFDVSKGGAANLIPAPTSRKVYTYISTGFANPTSPVTLGTSHELNTTNVNDAALGLGVPGDPARADLINWALGQAVPGTETRHVMGDPMHSQPAVVIYGGSATAPEAVVYVPTNDGYLHAIDADTGVELWSFIPQEILRNNLKRLYQNPDSSIKEYTLDGEVRVLKFDVNGDGTIETGDRVRDLYFGQARGGDKYYALDVTSKEQSEIHVGNRSPPCAGKTWSPVSIARVSAGDGPLRIIRSWL